MKIFIMIAYYGRFWDKTRWNGTKVKTSPFAYAPNYFCISQHLQDMLELDLSALAFMMKCFPEIKEVEDMRKSIGRYGLTGKQQVGMKVDKFTGTKHLSHLWILLPATWFPDSNTWTSVPRGRLLFQSSTRGRLLANHWLTSIETNTFLW